MTTRHRAVRRERPQGWPIFEELDLPDGIGVLSVELRRHPSEKVSAVVAEASKVLAAAIAPPLGSMNFELWLTIVGGSYRESDRLAVYYADRVGLWASVEASGLAVPKGRRAEAKVHIGDRAFTLVGVVGVEKGDVPAAIEVTRQENAVLVATLASDPIAELMALARPAAGSQHPALFRAAVDRMSEQVLVARGFGEFDDAVVGAELFASDSILDVVETRMSHDRSGH